MVKITAKPEVPHTLSFRVSDETYSGIERAMRDERRKESDVCRALIERGLAAYMRDKHLFEEDAPKYRSVPQTRNHDDGKRTSGDQKKTGTGNR